MKITCLAIILVVGLAAVYGAKLPTPNHDMGNEKDTLEALRSSLMKLMIKKRSVLKSPANEKRDFDIGRRGQCNIKDFVFLFTSLPGIRNALDDIGEPDDVIEIVQEIASVFGQLQSVMEPSLPFPTSFK
ncbi:uncharacterized protein LOC117330884 [Pecten maximus]|uniref:uncharacterized protein LOC117330884 n=1 Tax=Pecten maximus TaxID=6579 RepID=UPI001458729E|nr:uncharacterized protein LOC117330884 [Pecten maximus]